jgi:error-prone DNA polymerase
MGFYQPAQLVRDARDHGVEVRPPDINCSDWDCTLEPLASGTATPCALRLGLRLVDGMPEKEAREISRNRDQGYSSLRAFWLRSGVTLATLERLAEADAFRSVGLDRRAALWAVKGLDGGTPQTQTARATSSSRPLLAGVDHGDLFDEAPVALPVMPPGEHVVEDYRTIGLSLKAHPCSFFRAELQQRGVITSREHRNEQLREKRVSVAGLVLVRQRPGTARGVIFLTLEDETGIVNAVVWPDIFEANRWTVMNAQLLLVRGRIQREGLVIHVVAESFIDLSGRLHRLRSGETPPLPSLSAPAESSPPRLLKSRDFH